MPNILIYDCEIVNMIPQKRELPVPGIRYCNGWTDFKGMGISVIGVYKSWTAERLAFVPDVGGQLQAFQASVSAADVIIASDSITTALMILWYAPTASALRMRAVLICAWNV